MKLGVCCLEHIARVSLGFKSLQNDFFYLSKETIDTFGIERTYLKPIFQLGDLNAEAYLQTKKPVQWVFYCKEQEQDIRGTGALRYIRAMEKRPATKKKQSGKNQTIKQALAAQGGGVWYMPKAKLHSQNIWLRKAFNTVYSPLIFESARAVDQRCNYVEPIDALDWRIVGAVLTSSLFALSAESYGSASMGAGALELPTTKILEVKVVDVRCLAENQKAKKELVSLVSNVWSNSQPVDWFATSGPPKEVQELDEWFLSRMGTRVTLDRIYSDLVATLRSRLTVAGDKDSQSKHDRAINISTVANGVADSVRPLLDSKSFPESFIELGKQTQPLDFKGAGKLDVECRPMMEQAALFVRNGSDEVLFEGIYPRSVAQVIVKAFLLGRRSFAYPVDPVVADGALKDFSAWFAKVLDKITIGCGMSAVGTKYEEDVHNAVLRTLHLEPSIASPEFYGEFHLQ